MNPLDLAPALMPITARPAIVFERGEGSYLFDGAGRRWVDWVQGWAVNTLGHASPVITRALDAQSRLLVTPSPAYWNRPALELADLLTANSCFDQVFFASSGAEANEGAIKLARRWGSLHKDGAFEIVTFVNAFHGRTLATMSASGKPGWDRMFPPQVEGFPKATLNDIESVRARIGRKTVAVMLEPIQGEAGVWPATVEFLRALRALCDEHRLLLIVDEVQTGCARTGELFAHQHAGIEPDIMTLGKGIGGGVPLSALLAKSHASCFQPGDQGGTYCGNPLMCAVGLAIVGTLLDQAFEARRAASAAHLRERMQSLSDELGCKGLRGRGHLLALDLGRPIGAEVVERAREHGLLVNSPRPDSLRLMPALDIDRAAIDEGTAILREVLRAM